MARFVVCRDGNVDVLKRGVGVTESNDRDGDFGAFFQSLMVGSGIRRNNKTRLHQLRVGMGKYYLFEGARVVISECARGKSSGNGTGTDMGSKFQDSSLSIGTGADDDDIGRILNGCNNSGGKNEFLPGLSNVDDVDTIRTSFPDIWFHVGLSPLALPLAKKILRSFWSQCGIERRGAWSCPHPLL